MLSKIGKWYSEVFLYKGSRWLTVVCQIAMLVSMTVNFVIVIARKLFGTLGWTLGGIVSAYEISQLTMIFVASCAAGYTWYTAGHIRIGLFRDNMKEKTRNILDAIVAFLGMIYVPIIVWGVAVYAMDNLSGRMMLSEIPVAPFMIIYCVVMAHLFLIFLRSFIGLVSKAMGKKFAHEPYLEHQ
ncbi:TRAP transporter small permease [Chloroflexota bacterium]